MQQQQQQQHDPDYVGFEHLLQMGMEEQHHRQQQSQPQQQQQSSRVYRNQPQYQYNSDNQFVEEKGSNDDDDPNRCRMVPVRASAKAVQQRTSDFARPSSGGGGGGVAASKKRAAVATYGQELDEDDAGYVDTNTTDRFDPSAVVLKRIRPPDADPERIKNLFLNLETRNSVTPIQVRSRDEDAQRFVIRYAVHDAARVLLGKCARALPYTFQRADAR